MAAYDPNPSRRQQATLAASIWAPQPQPSDTTWPQTLDSFSRVAEQEDDRDQHTGNIIRREDVFGPVPTSIGMPPKLKDVGAIGDGRKKGSPEFEDTHVEQLLRTLNLNSPAPTFRKPPALNLTLNTSPGSPDFSPASATSSLMTPTDLSPSRSFDCATNNNANVKVQMQLQSPYELSPSGYTNQPSLLFDHFSPGRGPQQESYIPHIHGQGLGLGLTNTLGHSAFSPLYRSSIYASPAPSSNTFPFFEPFTDNPTFHEQSHQQNQLKIPASGVEGLSSSIHAVQSQSQYSPPNNLSATGQGNSKNNLALPRTVYNPTTPPAPHASRGRLPAIPMDWRLHPQPSSQPPPQGLHSLQSGTGEWLSPSGDSGFRGHNQNAGATKFASEFNSPGAVGHVTVLEEMNPLGLRNSFVFQQSNGHGQGIHGGQHQGHGHGGSGNGGSGMMSMPQTAGGGGGNGHTQPHEPINFLSLLHPSSSPPYGAFVERIIKASDQQASIFLQQKLKVADLEERAKIVDAICARGFEMMAHRFGNWAVQRCLEAASVPEERRKMVACMRGRVVELATNCYGCHVLQKALDCEEDIRLLIVSELLLGDPAQTLVNKHASHVWRLTPIQHAFENLEVDAKDGIVDELINNGSAVFGEVAKNQWGSYCIQHILEHGSETHRNQTLQHLLDGLLDFATSEQGAKSVTKALKEGGKATLDRIVERMCEPAKGSRRAMIVDLALTITGSQLIASVLPTADKDQRALLYECIRGHIVTLRGCKTGSKVIWLLCVSLSKPEGVNQRLKIVWCSCGSVGVCSDRMVRHILMIFARALPNVSAL
ncbi:hypothetical protein H0H81_009615 [Sphagnurus paluster]|uniref:PUM-HD domain-containing protein n=1 Tax=Sphagnurus paluster TaxID=117069 RepID=A0A9P7GQA8_9AGAR|nr:hypothetical protein H0H81_009615 [Sphagnurus paluster]